MSVYKKKNKITDGLSGKFGDVGVFRQVNGRTILAHTPSEPRSFSEKQKDQQTDFRYGAKYAKAQMADPIMNAEYAKGIAPNKNNVYRVALTDYMNAPVIHHVKARAYTGKAGELINIKATDDFRVSEVKISIFSGAGRMLEKGVAERVRLKPDYWRYRTTVDNPVTAGTVVKVRAFDIPGNETLGEWSLGIPPLQKKPAGKSL